MPRSTAIAPRRDTSSGPAWPSLLPEHMTTPSFKTAEALDAAWFAPAGGALAPVDAKTGIMDASRSPEVAQASAQARGRVFSRVLRVARDLALGLSLIAAIPLTVIGVSGHTWGWNSESVR